MYISGSQTNLAPVSIPVSELYRYIYISGNQTNLALVSIPVSELYRYIYLVIRLI